MTETQLADLRDALHLAELFIERGAPDKALTMIRLSRVLAGDLQPEPREQGDDTVRGAGGTL